MARPRRPPDRRLAPRLGDYVGEERSRHFRKTNEDGRIVSVMLGKEEGARVELHQGLTITDRPELQHQNRVVVPESRE